MCYLAALCYVYNLGANEKKSREVVELYINQTHSGIVSYS